MSKCSECGFLAVWLRNKSRFDEASEYLRVNGKPEDVQNNESAFHAKCFIQEADLVSDLGTMSKSVAARVFNYSASVLEVIDAERSCNGYTPWMQGFHPKEHLEMKVQEELRKAERRHANISLSVAVIGALTAAFMTYLAANLGADATKESAKWQVEALQKQTEAQLEMTKMQIEAQKEMAKNTPAPQIILKMPLAPTK